MSEAYIFSDTPLGSAAPDLHLLQQAIAGEFGVYHAEAQGMTAAVFAAKYRQPVTRWGRTGYYLAVSLEGTTYLWEAESGKYDGWDRAML